ncbi:MAG: hypothetical protein M3063_04535 [Actinomycetota bacterium]|nr:hypothetical protein [Actinomycetota bacterium]
MSAWTKRFFDRMPLPDLEGDDFRAAHFNDVGQAVTSDLGAARRVACLSEVGINILQQRLTFHLTRVEVPTNLFNQEFAHTMEEADLLEDWVDTLTDAGWSKASAEIRFETFLRSRTPTLRDELLDAQARSHVRTACRREAVRLVAEEVRRSA